LLWSSIANPAKVGAKLDGTAENFGQVLASILVEQPKADCRKTDQGIENAVDGHADNSAGYGLSRLTPECQA
jgi:hypothetical protein